MSDQKKIEFIDYLVLIVKWRRLLIPVLLITMVLSYLIVYFTIEEEFQATALIIPSEDQTMGAVSGLLKGLSNLPVDLGGKLQKSEVNDYNTIIYSRTSIEEIIEKFNLVKEYKVDTSAEDYMEHLIKRVRSQIDATETRDFAYEITVSSNSPQNAANIANHIIEMLNRSVIELRTSKSRENRIFLEERINDIRSTLRTAEDSMMAFQKQTGLLAAEDQVRAIVGAYADLETQLITKQAELAILEKIMDIESPLVANSRIQVEQYEKRINELKRKGEVNSPLLAYTKLPDNIINYFRLFRTIEINNAILEFVIPLYEQARFEEHKTVPILQVIDYAIPPAKKSFPPRTVITLAITFAVFILLFFYILVRENENFSKSEKLLYIRKNIFRWKD